MRMFLFSAINGRDLLSYTHTNIILYLQPIYFKIILIIKMLKKKKKLPNLILIFDCLKFVTPAHLLTVCCWSVRVTQELKQQEVRLKLQADDA